MYRALIKLHVHIKNRVLDLSYAYGFFVADHSLYIILVCFGVFLLSLFQITTNVPPPGSSLEIFAESLQSFRPVRARLELNTSDPLHDKQPDKPLWYSGYPLAYVQHIVIRCSSSTSQSTCLLRARDIRDRLLSDTQLDENCLRVGEPINAQQMNSYLPSFGCLFLSPLNLWSNDISNIINNEREILELIPSLSKRYADIIFGIPQKYFSSTKPLTYAITLILTNASNEFRQDIKKRLFALEEQTTSQDDIIHIYFSKKPLLYYLPLVLIYIVVFLYIYYSVNQFECVKSKWGLALAATVQIVVSLLISLALSSLFHMTPRLDGGEVFPYLVIFIGLENLVVLTRAVTSSQAQKQYDDIRERVAHALRAESWTISKHLFYEFVIVMIGFITCVPTIRDFCQLALIGILIDFLMQINFWLAVLSIDIRRFTVGLRKKKNPNYEIEPKDIRRSLPLKMPSIVPKRHQQQQHLHQSQWARYRVLQRGIMFLLLIWVILIFYKSCLIVDLLHRNVQIDRDQIKDYVPEKMLNEHFGSSSASHSFDSSNSIEDPLFNNTHLPNFEWQTLLSFDHWPTLFSYYNISYDNRYLSIMPSIYLPVVSSEGQHMAKAIETSSKPSHRPLIDATMTSTSSSLIDRRFSTALWELLFIFLFGLTLFSTVYFCFFSTSLTLNSFHQRSFAFIKSDQTIVPTILIPPTSNLLIESMCFHDNGNVLSVAYSDGSISMWNPQTGGILFTQQRFRSTSSSNICLNHVWCSMMIDEYRCILGCSDGQIEIYTNHSRIKPSRFSYEDLGGITHLLRATPTAIICTTRRGYLIAFEYLNHQLREIYIKRLHQWPIRVCQIDFNASLIFTGSDDYSIKVTNLSNGHCLHTLQKHQSPVNCLAIDPNHPTTLISGCFNGSLCLWTSDDLRQMNVNAHPTSIVLDVNFSGPSSNILSLGSDKRLCIWSYSNFQLIHELNEITSQSLMISRTNYLFYCQMNYFYIYDTLNTKKISTKQFPIPFLNPLIDRDENELNIEKMIYSSQSETLILQNSDVIYAMHLPQHLFLLR